MVSNVTWLGAVTEVLLVAILLGHDSLAQPSGALPFDPRHHIDRRCLPAVRLDPDGKQRDPSSTSSYLYTAMQVNATVTDCARLCCGDWSCEAFAFVPAKAAPGPSHVPTCKLTGDWCVPNTASLIKVAFVGS